MTASPTCQQGGISDRWFLSYGRVLGLSIGGYLFFDRAFAYLHVPGTPLYVGELVLGAGLLVVASRTGSLRPPTTKSEWVFALLGAFACWGAILLVADVFEYGLDAVRDSALWYYSLFAVVAYATVARSPAVLTAWISGFSRLVPWLVMWIPVSLVAAQIHGLSMSVPGTEISVLAHKPGDMAVALLLALGFLLLFPERRGRVSLCVWSAAAVGAIGIIATQNRGGLIAVLSGCSVGLAMLDNRATIVRNGIIVVAGCVGVAALFSSQLTFDGGHGRQFSAAQLLDNVASLSGSDSGGDLNGTINGRQELWTRIINKQVDDGHLFDGSGFGINLASEVGVYEAGEEALRSPHNSQLDIMARMGLIGIFLWVSFWVGWFWRMILAAGRLAREQRWTQRSVVVLSMMVVVAVLVSASFDPLIEGPQGAVLLWTLVGIGVAVSSSRVNVFPASHPSSGQPAPDPEP